jgi:hypothetical protein
MAVVDGMKYCPECQTDKPTDDFYISNHSSDGLVSYCKICIVIKEKQRRVKVRTLKSENIRLFTENMLLKELVFRASSFKDETKDLIDR